MYLKHVFFGVLVVVLSGCTQSPPINQGPPIDHTFTASGQDSRAQFLIIHYTAGTFEASLKMLTEGESSSSHYLVGVAPPTIYQLVDENRRAFHAGASSWRGQTHLNAASIGVEIVNCGPQKWPDGTVTFHEYPREQIDRVVDLVKWIVERHKIRADRILGHSDIAPQRKVDPGSMFPWERFAAAGLIRWPDQKLVYEKYLEYEVAMPDVAWFQKKLAVHGFLVPSTGVLDRETRMVISAFQSKYRRTLSLGDPDAETAAILDVVASWPEPQ